MASDFLLYKIISKSISHKKLNLLRTNNETCNHDNHDFIYSHCNSFTEQLSDHVILIASKTILINKLKDHSRLYIEKKRKLDHLSPLKVLTT